MKTAALFLPLLLLPISGLAQEKTAEPPPSPRLADVPRNLAEMLEAALRSNPQILQAEAKVRQAQANLNQARLKVMEEVVTAFHEREKQEAAIRGADVTLERMKQMVKVGTVNPSELAPAEQAHSEAKAKLMQGEAHARYLLGLGGLVGEAAGLAALAPGQPPAERPRRERPPIPEKYRAALEKEVSGTIDFSSTKRLAFSLQTELQTQVVCMLDLSYDAGDVSLEGKSLRGVLTAAADIYGVAFVFRDYGVLLTTRERAATMNAPTFPEDVPLKE
jgi:hypothetical protein